MTITVTTAISFLYDQNTIGSPANPHRRQHRQAAGERVRRGKGCAVTGPYAAPGAEPLTQAGARWFSRRFAYRSGSPFKHGLPPPSASINSDSRFAVPITMGGRSALALRNIHFGRGNLREV